jgi:pimeloyl-ACP methyl ester carboxylesterase
MPNSRHLYEPNGADAAARGLRLICYDRPGYGGSTPQPGRTVASCAADVRAICAELDISRLAIWGISGGGPHVLACAALLPDLVVAAASLAEQAAMMASLLTPADAAVLKDDLADYLLYTGREGLAPGGEGWWEDCVAFARPWGFELSDITIPVLVMQGRQDQFVPFGHGQWLAAHVPGAQARLLEDDGHLTLLVNRIGEVHAWLADQL